MVSPLVDVSRNPLGLEFAAALYESFAADFGSNRGYALAASQVAEAVERRVYESLDSAMGVAWR